MSWQDFAYTVDDIETFISFLLLFVSFFIFRVNSTTVTLLVWVVGNFIMERIAPVMMSLSDNYPEIIRQLWYVTWVAFYVAMLVAILFLHKKLKIPSDKYCKSVSFVIMVLIVLQVFRYCDRFILNIGLTKEIYKWGVLTLNLVPLITLIIIFISAAYAASKDSRRGSF